MSVKSKIDLAEVGIEYNEKDVWVCNNCRDEFVGFDEDRPSGKFSLRQDE
ncbi:MAG: hypothetical protein IBX39_08130 [Candidatus Methanoperedenaceae archaeon]|nr:hypothetical protein [Candidatus Methanoperedenaceae archaeon]